MKRFHEDSRYYILVDAGGSYIKSIIINREKDIIPDSFSITEIDSLGSQEYILRTITQILENNIIKITEYGTLTGIAFSFPGPFDYQNGISMMEHKYQGILGIRLQKELVSRLKLPKDFPVLFEEDSVAFLKGEVSSGSLEGVERIIGITLGTGLGSAFMAEGKIIKNDPLVPVSGELWNFPDGEGILEDSISSRAIINIYRDITELPENKYSVTGVGSLADIAKNGDADSIRTFSEFGRLMGAKMKIHADNFQAECLVIGGQIAKSFELFSGPLKKELSSVSSMKKITQASDINNGIFFGLLEVISKIEHF